MNELAFFWDLFKGAAALWLALYIFTRGGIHNRPWLAAAALGVWSFSPFSAALMRALDPIKPFIWLRIMAGVWPITIGFFFGVALSLASEFLPKLWKVPLIWLSQFVLILGFVLGGFCSLTNLIFDYGSVKESFQNFVPGNFTIFGPLQPAYLIYSTVTPVMLVLILAWAYRKSHARRETKDVGLKLLIFASSAWLVGIIIQNLLFSLQGGNQRLFLFFNLSDPLFISAILLLGWSIVQHNAIVRGRIIFKDFLLSGFGFGLIILTYTTIPWFIGRNYFRLEHQSLQVLILLFTSVAIVTHMLMETVRRQVDELFQPQPIASLRSDMSHLLQASRGGASLNESLHTLENIRTKTEIRNQINKQLLRDLHSVDGKANLLQSPLFNLSLMQLAHLNGATDRQKINQILNLLNQAVDYLKSESTISSQRKAEILNILSLRIREGLDRAEITLRLHVHPRKYDRLLAEGLALLADAIIELEDIHNRESK